MNKHNNKYYVKQKENRYIKYVSRWSNYGALEEQ